jgi:hypothetical protein
VAEHLVQLWIHADQDPTGIDWQAWLPKGIAVEHVQVKTFPWADVEHEITWWILRPLSAEEWGELDVAESELLGRIVGDSQFQGMAGPIPLEMENDYRRESPSEGEGEPDD